MNTHAEQESANHFHELFLAALDGAATTMHQQRPQPNPATIRFVKEITAILNDLSEGESVTPEHAVDAIKTYADGVLTACLHETSPAHDAEALQTFIAFTNKMLCSLMINSKMDPTEIQHGLASTHRWISQAERGLHFQKNFIRSYIPGQESLAAIQELLESGELPTHRETILREQHDTLLKDFTHFTGYDMEDIPAGVMSLFSYCYDIEITKTRTQLQQKYGDALPTLIQANLLPREDLTALNNVVESAAVQFRKTLHDSPAIADDPTLQLSAMIRQQTILSALQSTTIGKA